MERGDQPRLISEFAGTAAGASRQTDFLRSLLQYDGVARPSCYGRDHSFIRNAGIPDSEKDIE